MSLVSTPTRSVAGAARRTAALIVWIACLSESLAAGAEDVVLRLGAARLREPDAILSLALAPDGASVIAGTMGGALVRYDATSGERLARAKRFDAPIHGIYPDEDGALRVFPYLGVLTRVEPDLSSTSDLTRGSCAMLCPLGDAVAAIDTTKTKMVVRAPGGEVIASRDLVGGGRFTALAGAPDASMVAVLGIEVGDDGAIGFAMLIDVATGTVLREGHVSGVHFPSAAFAPDGEMVVLGATDGGIWRWSVEGGEPTRLHGEHGGTVAAVAFSGDGRWVASGGIDRRVALFDVDRGEVEWTQEVHRGAVAAVCFSADGARLFSAGHDRRVRVLDVRDGAEVIDAFGHDAAVTAVAWSPDGSRVATAGQDGSLIVWNAESGELLDQTSAGAGFVFDLAFSPVDGTLAVAAQGKPLMRVDPLDLTAFETFEGAALARSVAFSPDGARVATLGMSGETVIWDWASRAERQRIAGRPAAQGSLAWSRSGDLAIGGRTVRVLASEAEGGEWIVRFERPIPGGVTAIAYSEDGAQLAVACGDKVIRRFDRDGKAVGECVGHSEPIAALQFARDGAWLASSGYGELSIRLWDVQGQVIRTLGGHDAAVLDLALSPDGTRLLSGSADATSVVWDAEESSQR